MKRFTVLLLILAMALAIGGCGDGDTEVAPDFALENAIGGTVALDDYAGTPVLLFFHMADG